MLLDNKTSIIVQARVQVCDQVSSCSTQVSASSVVLGLVTFARVAPALTTVAKSESESESVAELESVSVVEFLAESVFESECVEPECVEPPRSLTKFMPDFDVIIQ